MQILKTIVHQERQYNISKWKMQKTVLSILAFLLTLLVFFPLNDMNNFNTSIPYHLCVDSLTDSQINKISQIKNVDKIGVRNVLFREKRGQNPVEFYDDNAMKFNSIELIEGRIPQKENELIAIGTTYEIGENITLQGVDSTQKEIVLNMQVVGVARDRLVGNTNRSGLIVSQAFKNKFYRNTNTNTMYLLLHNISDIEIEQFQSILVKMGIVEKNIHRNDFYIKGILGNKTQVFLLTVFGIMAMILVTSILNSICSVFIKKDALFFYKLKIVGLDNQQLKKAIRMQCKYLVQYLMVTEIICCTMIYVAMQVFHIQNSLTILLCSGGYVLFLLSITVSNMFRKLRNEAIQFNVYAKRFGYDIDKIKLEDNIKNIDEIYISNRNNQIYKKRYKTIVRNMSFIMILFVVVSTVYSSINLSERLQQVFRYNEKFIIYPDMVDQYSEIDDFQTSNIYSNTFFKRLKEINGIQKIIVKEWINGEIKNKQGEVYQEIFEVLNEDTIHLLESKKQEGDLNKEGIILNGDKLVRYEGVECEIGDKIQLSDTDGNTMEVPVVAVVDDKNSGELFFVSESIPRKLNPSKNYTYSVSIIPKQGQKKEVEQSIQLLLEEYPMLQIRTYDIQFKEIKNIFSNIYLILGLIIFILVLIGISSFIQIERLNLYERKREFALLEINGMSTSMIMKSILFENINYVKKIFLITMVMSVPISYGVNLFLNRFANLLFIQYQYSWQSLLFVIVVFGISILITSYMEYGKQIKENSIVRIKA